MNSTVTDLTWAWRRWTRRPALALTVIAILAAGIGATTGVFSVMAAVLFKPSPWRSAEQLVAIYAVFPERRQNPATSAGWDRGTLNWPTWQALGGSPAFSDVAVWRSSQITVVQNRIESEALLALHVSSRFFHTLGLTVERGRTFTKEEDDGPSDGVILTHEAWARRFGSREDILGQKVFLGAPGYNLIETNTVIGVLPAGFKFGEWQPEFFLPVGSESEVGKTYGVGSFRAVARLAPNVSIESALGAVEPVVRRMATGEPMTLRLLSLVDDHLGNSPRILWLLFGGAALLLVVACANVAGLLLGDARGRRTEIAVRVALGGDRRRIVRQLFAEHSVLAIGAAAAGLVVAPWVVKALIVLMPTATAGTPVETNFEIVLFACGLGSGTLLCFGLAPVLALSRTRATEALRESGRHVSLRRKFGQQAIVAAQVAIALVLIVSAGLFGEAIYRLTSRPLGFDPANLAVASTIYSRPQAVNSGELLRQARAAGQTDIAAALEQQTVALSAARTDAVLDRFRAIPGVLNVAGASAMPLARAPQSVEIRPDASAANALVVVQQQVVTASYFTTMRITILAGHAFTAADQTVPNPAVISQEFERRVFGGAGLSKRFEHVRGSGGTTAYQVVGVAANVKQRGFSDADDAAFYALDRHTYGVSQFIVRTAGDPAISLPLMRRAIAQADARIVLTGTTTTESSLASTIAEERTRAALSASFGASTLGLSVFGLYGLAVRQVADRRREMAVRLALGASPNTIRLLVLGESARTLAAGFVVGLPAAFVTWQLCRSMLFGISAIPLHIFFSSVAILAGTTIIATLVPAIRASAIDPARSLHES